MRSRRPGGGGTSQYASLNASSHRNLQVASRAVPGSAAGSSAAALARWRAEGRGPWVEGEADPGAGKPEAQLGVLARGVVEGLVEAAGGAQQPGLRRDVGGPEAGRRDLTGPQVAVAELDAPAVKPADELGAVERWRRLHQPEHR